MNPEDPYYYYDLFAQAQDRLPSGFHRTKSGVELKILEKVFTKKEIRILAFASGKFESAAVIAERAGLKEKSVERRLNSIIMKGAVWRSSKGGVRRFRLVPIVVGWWELNFRVIDEEVAKLWEQWMEEGCREYLMKYSPGLSRVVPAPGVVKTEWVLPYDDLRAMIDECVYFRIIDCVCKRTKEKLGQKKCDIPVRVCTIMTKFRQPEDEYCVKKEDIFTLIDKMEEYGVVYSVANMAKGVFYICNCCSCCCDILQGITNHGLKSSMRAANYYAKVDAELCTGCGICENDRCQMSAIKVIDGTAVVSKDDCLGCGACASKSGCPDGAITLERLPDSEMIHPPETYNDWEKARAENRGIKWQGGTD
jgi:H+/Na+-translocating ferredoxin:NAD+ oxidoreductase subunit B